MSAFSRIGLLSVTLTFSMSAPGCLSPIATHQAVLSYDHTVTQVSSEELLLNIVRARYHRPVHFTTISSVAATFDFRMTAGITPPEGDARGLVAPLFSTTVAENPTVTIIPMDGAEFEKRLLTPLEESRFLALIELGGDLGMALRMMGAAMRLETDGGMVVFKNDPASPREYEAYRRRSLHLSVLHRRHQLFIEPVMVEQVWAGGMASGPTPTTFFGHWKRGIDGTRLRISGIRSTSQPPARQLRRVADAGDSGRSV